MKRAISMFLLCCFLSSFFAPRQVEACSCFVPDSALEAMERADATIRGKVIDVKKRSIDNSMYDVALFEVSRIWKGIEQSQVVLHTSWSSCQFSFEIGQEYLLYPYEHEGRYHVINCGRNAEINHAEADLAALGEGRPPTEVVDLTAAFRTNGMNLYLFVALAVTGVPLYVFLYLRYRRVNAREGGR
ncbi:MAG TPA: hypothetical protein VEZ72_12640 [Paenibacillus sp.]|nr:hypothetical protein [Paenibacillus sp.]